MISGNEINQTEFQDFCRNHSIDFNLMDLTKAEKLIDGIKHNLTFFELASPF